LTVETAEPFSTVMTLAPFLAAVMEAMKPEAPQPTTTTSHSSVWSGVNASVAAVEEASVVLPVAAELLEQPKSEAAPAATAVAAAAPFRKSRRSIPPCSVMFSIP